MRYGFTEGWKYWIFGTKTGNERFVEDIAKY